jgi:hypothetical protein
MVTVYHTISHLAIGQHKGYNAIMTQRKIATKQRPGVRTAMLSITMTPEVKQRLAALADKWDRSLSWTAEKILRDYLKAPR